MQVCVYVWVHVCVHVCMYVCVLGMWTHLCVMLCAAVFEPEKDRCWYPLPTSITSESFAEAEVHNLVDLTSQWASISDTPALGIYRHRLPFEHFRWDLVIQFKSSSLHSKLFLLRHLPSPKTISLIYFASCYYFAACYSYLWFPIIFYTQSPISSHAIICWLPLLLVIIFASFSYYEDAVTQWLGDIQKKTLPLNPMVSTEHCTHFS